MIILHEAIDINGFKRIGYVLKKYNSYYILTNDIFYNILPDTIRPILTRQTVPQHTLEESLNGIIGKSIIHNFNNRGVYFLEDLSNWTDTELMSIRGIGKVTLKKIRDVMNSLKIV